MTSFATKALWVRCLFVKKALYHWSTIPCITFLSLLARSFANILYMHPTKEIGLNSPNDYWASTFTFKRWKMHYILLVILPLLWNSFTSLITFPFKVFQKHSKKMKLMSSRSGPFWLSQSQITSFTSCSSKQATSIWLSSQEICEKVAPSSYGLLKPCSMNLLSRKLLTSSFTNIGFTSHLPFISTPSSIFFPPPFHPRMKIFWILIPFPHPSTSKFSSRYRFIICGTFQNSLSRIFLWRYSS